MADPLEDQEPLMKGPPFNSIVDLTRLSHEEYITKAKEGHPPLGVLSPTMQSHIDGLEVTRESYASSTNPMRKQSTNPMRTVFFVLQVLLVQARRRTYSHRRTHLTCDRVMMGSPSTI